MSNDEYPNANLKASVTAAIERLIVEDSADIYSLMKVAGLDPSKDLVGRDLSLLDLAYSDIDKLNLKKCKLPDGDRRNTIFLDKIDGVDDFDFELSEDIDYRDVEYKETDRRHIALIFIDAVNYSTLKEAEHPIFVEKVLGEICFHLKAVDSNSSTEVIFKNIWGDAVFVAMRSVKVATEFALSVQRALKEMPFEELGLPNLEFRIGCHYGPVIEIVDPVTARKTPYGDAVSVAARLVPVASQRAITASEDFVSILNAEAKGQYLVNSLSSINVTMSSDAVNIFTIDKKEKGIE